MTRYLKSKISVFETKGDLANKSGTEAEEHAKRYLLAQGMQFVEQNYRVPMGELDLIFKDKNQWVFVEVKYRKTDSRGKAAESFTSAKRSKMIRAIMCYLQQLNLNLHHTDLRIDLVAIDDEHLSWIKNV